MRRRIPLILSFAALLLSGPGRADVSAVTFQTAYFDADENRISGATLPASLTLRIRLIPGSTFGPVTSSAAADIPVRIGESATFDLNQIRRDVERSAAPLSPEASGAGLAVVPKETRIARVATIAYDAQSGEGMYTGFRTAKGDSVYIVYFDRPCQLTGVTRQQGRQDTYNVKVDAPGFSWLKIVMESPVRGRTMLLAPSEPVVLGLTPPEARGERPSLRVTPGKRKTFGPTKPTTAGTVFYIKVLKKGENDAIRLHRCGSPCDTAVNVKTWEAADYKAGDRLYWRADRDGEYYFWDREGKTGSASYASADEMVGEKLRISFASGTVLEVWYAAPPQGSSDEPN